VEEWDDRGGRFDVLVLAALEAECARLIALGAARLWLLPADDENESCITMQDIEGNEFCLD
jgi:glyoxalase superfamily protein